jgi:hypothetical protein
MASAKTLTPFLFLIAAGPQLDFVGETTVGIATVQTAFQYGHANVKPCVRLFGAPQRRQK